MVKGSPGLSGRCPIFLLDAMGGFFPRSKKTHHKMKTIIMRTEKSSRWATMGVLILMAMAAPSARAALETYFDFEDNLPFASDSPGLQATGLNPILGSISAEDSGTGIQLNAVTPSMNSSFLVTPTFAFPTTSFTLGGLTTTGLTDVNLSFALLSTATTSFTTLGLFYSI